MGRNALGGGVPAASYHPVNLLDEGLVDPGVDDGFHHGQMLEIIVRLEEGVSGKELDQDASDAPDVAGIGPPEPEDDLGRPVMPGRHDRRVVLVLEGCRAKVDQANLGVQENLSLAGLAVAVGGAGRRDLSVVRKRLVLVAAKQDVLGLEIRVDQVEIMKN